VPAVCAAISAGREAVAKACRAIFDAFADGQWTSGRFTRMQEDRALSEWTFVGTTADGKQMEVLGLDILDVGTARCISRIRFARTVGHR